MERTEPDADTTTAVRTRLWHCWAGSGGLVWSLQHQWGDACDRCGFRQRERTRAVKVAHLSEPAEERVVFRDGLGVRERRETNAGEVVEWFHLDPAFAAVEHPLRERVIRLTKLQHAKFARIMGLEPAAKGRGPILVSSHVVGTRLSEVLEMAGHGLVTFEPGAGLQITREVLAALAVLHDSRNVSHGALAPERVVLTAPGRIVMVEHVLAHALDRLQRQRHQLWREWRIPTPPAAGPVRLDMQTDLAQAGLLALAALLGRPLDEEEYPHRLRGLLPLVQDRLARSPAASIGSDVVAWLERLAPVDSRRAFKTVREAQQAFEALVSGGAAALGISPARVKTVMTAVAAINTVPSPAHAPAASDPPPEAAAPIVAERTSARAPARTRATAAPPQEPPPAVESSADSEIDIEALLRLEAELEGGTSAPEPAVPFSRASVPTRARAASPEAASAPEPAPDAAPDPSALHDELSLETLAQERVDLERQFAELVATVAPPDEGPAHLIPETPATSEPLVDARVLWSSMPAVDLVDANELAPGEVEARVEPTTEEIAELVSPANAAPVEPSGDVAEVEAVRASDFSDAVEDAALCATEPAAAVMPVETQPSASFEHVPAEWWKEALPWRGEADAAFAETVTATPDMLASLEAADALAPERGVGQDFGYLTLDADSELLDAVEPAGDTPADPYAVDALTDESLDADVSSVAAEPAAADDTYGLVDVAETASDALDVHDTAEGETAVLDVTASPAESETEAIVTAWDVLETTEDAIGDVFADASVDVTLVAADSVDVDAAYDPAPEAAVDVHQADGQTDVQVDVEADAEADVQAEMPATEPSDTVVIAADAAETIETETTETGIVVSLVDAGDAVEPAAEPLHEDTAVATVETLAASVDADVLLGGALEGDAIEAVHADATIADAFLADSATADAATADAIDDDVVAALAADPAGAVEDILASAEPEPMAAPVESADASVSADVNLGGELATEPAGAFRLFADFAPIGLRDEADVEASADADADSLFDRPHADVGAMTAASSLLLRGPGAADAPDWRHAFLGTPSDAAVDASPVAPFAEPFADPFEARPADAADAVDLPIDVTGLDVAGIEPDSAWSSAAVPDIVLAHEVYAEQESVAESDDVLVEDAISVGDTELVAASVPDVEVAQQTDAEPETVVATDDGLVEGTISASNEEPVADSEQESEPFVLVAPTDLVNEPDVATAIAAETEPEHALVDEAFESPGLFDLAEPDVVDMEVDDVMAVAVADAPATVPEVVVVDEGADGDVWNVLPSESQGAFEATVPADAVTASDAPELEADTKDVEPVALESIALVVDAPAATPVAAPETTASAKRKKKRSRRKKGAQPEPLPTPVAVPEVVAPAATSLVPVDESPTEAPSVPDAPARLARPSRLADPPADGERSASTARASLLERQVPTWTPPADLNVLRQRAAQLPSEQFSASADATSADVAAAPPGVTAPVLAPATVLPTRSAPAAISAPTTLAPNVTVAPSESWGASAAVAASDAYRPFEHEIRAVGMPDLEDFPARGGRTSLTSMADPIGHSHGSAPTSRAVPIEPRVIVTAPEPSRGINWRRLVAASVLIALFQGVAFAAWWWVQPGAQGTLVVQTSKIGVEVLLDDKVVGRTPFREEVAPGRHRLGLRQGTNVREMPVEISVGVVTTQAIDWPSLSGGRGNLQVTSNPAGAEVFVNGKSRGDAPLLLEDLPAGDQVLMLKSDAGTVTITTTVVPDQTTPVEVKIFAGWILVDAPVEVNLLLNGRDKIGSSMDGQILLPPGPHRVQAVNEGLGIRQWFSVTVEPGAVRRVPFTVAPATLTLQEEAEVFIDGTSAGTTPGTISIQPGTHDIVIRPVGGVERRQALTVRSKQRLEF
jgi:hypothetical protein